MTNAEKYLKDGVDVNDFLGEFNDYCALQTSNQASSVRLAQFLSKKFKPQLTEDERVILRNIDKRYKLICKDNAYNLFVKNGTYDLEMINPLNKLFQFIEPRRRISNRGVARRRVKMDIGEMIGLTLIIICSYGIGYLRGLEAKKK